MATKRTATKKSATKTRPVPGWSTEGGWERAVPGGRLFERPALRSPEHLAKLDERAFGAAPPADPADAIRALAERVDRARAREIPIRKLDVAIGVAWGMRVCALLGWLPRELRDDAGRVVPDAIVSPDRRYFVSMRPYGERVLERGADNTLELLLSMLRDGTMLPPAEPGAYVQLG